MYLGLDIGTTSVCAVVLDREGKIVYTVTKPNYFHAQNDNGERTQNAQKIYELCFDIYKETYDKFKIKSVGVSGQMHGILYLDENGLAVSPLYSWQDERGNLSYKNSTYAQVLTALSNYKMATGYGCTSLFFDYVNNLIPKNAVTFCTVGDYVAMRLANRKKPLVNQTNAASLGLYDVENHSWDIPAIEKSDLPLNLFPETTADVLELGRTEDDALVYTAIGDNQASVYGTEVSPDSVVVNIGTGSQLSIICKEYKTAPSGCEIRPYFNGQYLAIGCALCGGYSYKLLKDFFNSMFGGEEKITYQTLNQWAESALDTHTPTTLPLFRGTRTEPSLRASVSDISEHNFNAQALTLSVLKGISKELKDFYDSLSRIFGERKYLIGSGNAVRMNPVLKRIIEKNYGKNLQVPIHTEEAAFGAALLAAEKLEKTSLKQFIRFS